MTKSLAFLLLCSVVTLIAVSVSRGMSQHQHLDKSELNSLQVGYCMGVVITNVPKCTESEATCAAQTKYVSIPAGTHNIPGPDGTNIPITITSPINFFPWGCKDGAVEKVAGTCPAKPHEIQDPDNNQQVIGGQISPQNTDCPSTATVKACKEKWVQQNVFGIPVLVWFKQCIVDTTATAQANQRCGGTFASYNNYTATCPL